MNPTKRGKVLNLCFFASRTPLPVGAITRVSLCESGVRETGGGKRIITSTSQQMLPGHDWHRLHGSAADNLPSARHG